MQAGFTPAELKAAGVTAAEIAASQSACTPQGVKEALAAGMTVAEIHHRYGCSATELLKAGVTPAELVKAGFTPGELAQAGLTPAELLKAGFTPSELKAAGYTAKELLAAGVSPKDLLAAGFTPADLLKAGITPKELLQAGVPVKDLKNLGVSAKDLLDGGATPGELREAGFNAEQLKDAGVEATASLANIPVISDTNPLGGSLLAPANDKNAQNLKNLNDIMAQQNKMQAEQKFQQKIQQRASAIQAYATQLIQGWKNVSSQTYVAATAKTESPAAGSSNSTADSKTNKQQSDKGAEVIKTGDILFAVIDNAVNSDEPGPILATIVNGPLKNSKLIGSFNLGANAEKLTISFKTLSVPGLAKTLEISAYAIDPNTGRTALSSSTDHHYLMRYGSLFASTFLEGFGNAFQSSDTQITIGGTGGTTNTTVQNGIGRSLTDNAVIGLATLGKAWGQQAQTNMSVPTTVQVYSGTPIGVLFLQDVSLDTKG